MVDPVLPIVAAVFGGISAANALSDLFKKWRSRKKKKAEELSHRVEQAFTKVPVVLKETCSGCMHRAGRVFGIGDGQWLLRRVCTCQIDTIAESALASIRRATEHFQRTLCGTYGLAFNAHALDLLGIKRTIESFSQDMVRTLGALYTGVHNSRRVPATPRSTTPFSMAVHMMRPVQLVVQLPRLDDYPAIPVPPLSALEYTGEGFAATLAALTAEASMNEFSASLAQDLDAISSVQTPTVPVDIRAGVSGSSRVLQEILSQYSV
jgi:hypothetical protein